MLDSLCCVMCGVFIKYLVAISMQILDTKMYTDMTGDVGRCGDWSADAVINTIISDQSTSLSYEHAD